MLQAINDRIKGWLGMTIVALITLPFAFWGISSYITGGGEQFAAKIDGVEVSAGELDFTFSQQRQKMLEQYGGELPIEESELKQQVLDQLINRKIIENTTYEQGYRISDASLTENIRKIFTRDGKFDRQLFDQVLQSRGRTIPQFEFEYRTEMRILQMRDALVNTGFLTDDDAKRLVALEDQERTVRLLTFRLDNYTSDVIVSDDEINNAYDVHAQQYMLPEKVSIDYVELTSEHLSADIKINEHDIKSKYDDYVASLSRKEKRKASHILLKNEDAAEDARTKLLDIKQQIANGASFEDLARKYSEDAGSAKQGGDLGWVEEGQMVMPFEEALFAQKKGEISEIVESEFGLHLIKLIDVKGETAKSYEEKRVDFENDTKQEAISNMLYELSENMAAAAYESPDSLDNVVVATGLKIQTSKIFTRDAGEGIANNELVRKEAFSEDVIQQGANSDIIELSPEHIIVLRVHDHEPATRRPLANVRAAIVNGIKLRAGHEKALAAAEEIRGRLESGENIEKLLAKGQKIETLAGLTRKDTSKADAFVLEAAFNMPRPDNGDVVVKKVPTYTGDVVLVILDKVNAPDSIKPERVVAVKSQWKQDVVNREFDATLDYLRASTDLYINPSILQQP